MNSGDPYAGVYQFVKMLGIDFQAVAEEMKKSFADGVRQGMNDLRDEIKDELKEELKRELLEEIQEYSSEGESDDNDDSSSNSHSDSSDSSSCSSNSRKRSLSPELSLSPTPAFDDEFVGEPTDRPYKRGNYEPYIPDCIYGKSVTDAEKLLRRLYPMTNYTVRPYMVDGKAWGLTCDYVKTRINVIVRNGVIVKSEMYLGRLNKCWLG
jgi:hypothetical protein